VGGVIARTCSKTGCGERAVATLVYSYADATATLGALSPEREPGAHDLCTAHALNLKVPVGWKVIRLAAVPVAPPPPGPEFLRELADDIRRIGLRDELPEPLHEEDTGAITGRIVELGRRGHLRVLADATRAS
jgi:hypothetical protein